MQEQEENPVNPQIETSLQNAGFWRRFFAYTLDGLIVVALSIALAKMGTIALLAGGLYTVLMLVESEGQTIGYKFFGIKVITVDGKPLSYGKAMLRWLGYYISKIPLYLGLLWIIWDKEKRGWHDKIANTRVVVTDPRPKVAQAILVIIASIIVPLIFVGIIINMLTTFKSKVDVNTEFGEDTSVSEQWNNSPQEGQRDYRNVNYQIEVK